MTDRLLAVGLWMLGIATVLIVTFAIAVMVLPVDALGTTLPRSGWVPALVGWGIGGGAALIAVGRAATDALPARTAVGLVLLACAIAAGAAIELTLMRWAVARFGVQAADPDLIGWASVLSPMVVLVGHAVLASTILPGPGGVAAKAITIAVSAGVLLSVASNLPGAADGITPLGVPLGIAMAAGACVAVAAVATAVVSIPRR
jgi:hypothetical protein